MSNAQTLARRSRRGSPEGQRQGPPANPFIPEVADEPREQEESLLTLGDPVLGEQGEARGPVLPPQSAASDLPNVLRLSGSLPPPQVAVVGLHGGSGATTAHRALERFSDPAAGLTFSAGGAVGEVPEHGAVVLVARTSGIGLERAAAAARQWGTGEMPGVSLLGLVLIADGPGIAKPLRPAIKRVAGMYPRTWRVEWVPEWHLTAEPSMDRVPRRVAGVAKKLSKWATERGLQPTPGNKEH